MDFVANDRADNAPLGQEVVSDGSAGDMSQAVTTGVARGATEPAVAEPIRVETGVTADPDRADDDSTSDEDDDYELARLRCRGDLPVKVNVTTGLPSGVASIRRDASSGRVRVIRPSGFRLAHQGITLAVDDSSVIFLDALSGFERCSGAPQLYMQGWAGSGFALRSALGSALGFTLGSSCSPCPGNLPTYCTTLAPWSSSLAPWPRSHMPPPTRLRVLPHA